MSSLFLIAALAIFLTGTVYVFSIFNFYRGLSKLRTGNAHGQPTVSVLVPARNESAHIEACLNSLVRQDYPLEKFEIIVVDDESEDDTARIVERIVSESSHRIRLLRVTAKPSEVSAKINALRLGLAGGASELVFTTDADCEVSPGWISSTVKYFEDSVGVVTGTTLFHNNNATPPLLFGIQFLDFLSHTACAAGAIGNGTVNNCNGSNMAFRRSAYDAVGGYESLAHLNSGDDSLLAQKIAATSRWEVRFNVDRSGSVRTTPAKTWNDFLQQRMRWAAQTADYRLDTLVFLASTFIFYVLLSLTLLGTVSDIRWFALFLFAFIPKVLVDREILKRFTAMSGTEELMQFYPRAALIHVPMVLLAVFGGFFGKFDWKGRSTRRRTIE